MMGDERVSKAVSSFQLNIVIDVGVFGAVL